MPDQSQKEKQVTAMLVPIAILFMITNFPFGALIISQTIFDWASKSHLNHLYYLVFWEVGVLLNMLNNSLNFYLYCMSAQFFRKTATELFLSYIPCLKTSRQ